MAARTLLRRVKRSVRLTAPAACSVSAPPVARSSTHRTWKLAGPAVLLFAVTCPCPAQLTWDGNCNTSWAATCNGGSTTNWMPDAVPTASDTCVATNATILVMSGSQAAQSLNATGGSLGIAVGKTLTLTQMSSMNNTTISGTLSCGPLALNGTTVLGGRIIGAGPVDVTFLNINGGAIGEVVFAPPNMTVVRANDMLQVARSFNIANGCRLENNGTGAIAGPLTIAGDANNGATFLNTGSLDSAGGTVNLLPIYEQTGGTTTVLGGRLSFNSANARLSGGGMTVFDDGEIMLTATVAPASGHVFDGLASVAGVGHCIFQSGPTSPIRFDQPVVFSLLPMDTSLFRGMVLASGTKLILNADVTNQGLAGLAGALEGTGEFINDGNLRYRTGQLDAPFVNLETVEQRAATGNDGIGLFENGSIENQGIWNHISGGIGILAIGDDSQKFLNKNKLIKPDDPGAQLLVLDVEFEQDGGEIVIEAGDMDFRRPSTWKNESSATIAMNSTLHYRTADHRFIGPNHVFTGPGTVTVGLPLAGVTLDVTDASLVLDVGPLPNGFRLTNDSEIVGEGTVTNTELFDWRGGRIGGTITSTEFKNKDTMLITGGSAKTLGGSLVNSEILVGVSNVTQSASFVTEANASIQNAGRWEITSTSTIGGPDSVTFENLLDLRATGAAVTAVISVRLDNKHTVSALNSATLELDGPVAQLSGGVLLDGNWIVKNGGKIIFPSGIIRIAPEAHVEANGVAIPALIVLSSIQGQAVVNGVLSVNAMITVEDGGRLGIQAGSTVVAPGGLQNGRGPADAGGSSTDDELTPDHPIDEEEQPGGFGPLCTTTPHIVTPLLENFAVIEPAPLGAIGSFVVDGDVLLHETSDLRLDIAGLTPCTEHDEVVIDGAATLGGTLRVEFQGGFVPDCTESFVVLTATAGLTGTFDEVISPVFGPGLRLTAVTGANDVTLVCTCAADLDGNGSVGFAELTRLLNAWGPCGVCPEDLDGNGTVGFSDLTMLLNAWGPCP